MAAKASRRLWILVALVLAFLLVKFFVADVYRIESDSMRPTLFGGEEGEPDPGGGGGPSSASASLATSSSTTASTRAP